MDYSRSDHCYYSVRSSVSVDSVSSDLAQFKLEHYATLDRPYRTHSHPPFHMIHDKSYVRIASPAGGFEVPFIPPSQGGSLVVSTALILIYGKRSARGADRKLDRLRQYACQARRHKATLYP